MADISILNIGGSDYNIKDATARTSIDNSLGIVAYKEDGNTASQAYSVVGTPINWKGNLYTLKAAVAKDTNWVVGTNLTAQPNLGKLTSNIKTYVNGSGELVFRDLTGADTVLPFSGTTISFPTSMTSMTLTNPSVEAQTIAQDTITLPYNNPKILLLMNNSGNARYISSVVSTNGYTVNIIANCPQSYGGGCCIAEIIGNAGDSVTLKTTGSWTMRSGAYGWIPQ